GNVELLTGAGRQKGLREVEQTVVATPLRGTERRRAGERFPRFSKTEQVNGAARRQAGRAQARQQVDVALARAGIERVDPFAVAAETFSGNHPHHGLSELAEPASQPLSQ